jgi:hypothetical protein
VERGEPKGPPEPYAQVGLRVPQGVSHGRRVLTVVDNILAHTGARHLASIDLAPVFSDSQLHKPHFTLTRQK